MKQNQWARETTPPMHRPIPGRRVDPKTLEVIEPPPQVLALILNRLSEIEAVVQVNESALYLVAELLQQRGERVVYMAASERWPPSRRKALEDMVKPIVIIWEDPNVKPKTPGELLAASMKELPALPKPPR